MGQRSKSKGWCGWFIVLVVAAVVAVAVVLFIRKKSDHSDEPAPVPGPPGAIEKKYSDALKLAVQFFDVQKCTFSFFHLVSVFHNVVLLLIDRSFF